MPKIRFDPDEEVLAELSPSRRSTMFPVLEFVVITGVVWLGIGLLDAYLANVATQWLGYVPEKVTTVPDLIEGQDVGGATAAVWGRRALLVAWAWLSWRRCLRHLLFRFRSRMILTDRRLVTATGHLRSQIGEVPLSHIAEVRHRGSDVSVYLRGGGRPLVLRDVPFTKKFAKLLRSRIPVHQPGPLY
ncbi:MAG TPA: hypothetical protein H9870_11135 [Candidatus Corynebacterium avicola]|uniref:DUF304 domain-containing protein n=1 Tax=Candidatus Corynebacterium avicola TaxID=2838527 RepID=A0A9D1RT23_9CORY|nr:hypothetical protein [Candidatus Corynebacterium avicola]